METIYKGYIIELCGHPLYSRDWIVYPEGKEEEKEFYPGYTLDQVKDIICTLVN